MRCLYEHKSVQEFGRDIDVLLEICKAVSLDDILRCVRSGRPLPKRSFMLTFDDGFREMHDVVAPILLQKGLSAVFFVNTDFIDNKKLSHDHKASLLIGHLRRHRSAAVRHEVAEVLRDNAIPYESIEDGLLSIGYHRQRLLDELAARLGVDFDHYLRTERPYLSSTQIRWLLDKGFDIGAHSRDHAMYSALSIEEQVSQTLESVRVITETFGLTYGVFAFPYTDSDVSNDFFLRVFASGLIDLCFGTSGIVKDTFTRIIQRFSLENPLMSADRILAYQYVKKLGRALRGRDIVVRS